MLNHQNSDVLFIGTLVPAHLLLRRAERPHCWHGRGRILSRVDLILRGLSRRGGIGGVDGKADVRLFNMVGAAPLLLFLILIVMVYPRSERAGWVSYAGSQTDDDGPLGVLHGAREGNEESPPVL